jgi:hypothetical protein
MMLFDLKWVQASEVGIMLFSFIHLCIKCLGHFSPLPPGLSLIPLPPPSPLLPKEGDNVAGRRIRRKQSRPES